MPRRDVDAFGSEGVVMDFLPRAVAGEGAGETRVHVARVAPGGTVGRHAATSAQVFAVVSGEVEVCGPDDVRRTLAPGLLALWETGEEHRSWTRDDSEGAVVVIVETTGTYSLPAAFREV